MKMLLNLALSFSLMASLAANAGTTIPKFSMKNEGKKIAIVSLSANNWGNSLDSINSKDGDDLVESQLNKMLDIAEAKFADKKLTVIPVKDFIGNKDFQLLAGEAREVGLPIINGTALPLMAESRKQMVKCLVDKDKAIALAKSTGADFVAIIYSEWAVKTGKFVPTSKALAKNVISIYDNKGKKVYTGRSDKMGNATLGGMGVVAVNEGTIKQWVIAYEKGMDALFLGKK